MAGQGWIGCRDWEKERTGCLRRWMVVQTREVQKKEAHSSTLSGRCLLEWGFWLNGSEMPQLGFWIFSFSHMLSHITFILGLIITCTFCELTWVLLKPTKLPAFNSSCSTSSRTEMPNRYFKRKRLEKELFLNARVSFHTSSRGPFLFLSKQILSLGMRKEWDQAGWSRIGLTLAYVGFASARFRILWYFLEILGDLHL